MSKADATLDTHARRFLLERLCANEDFAERPVVESHVQACDLCAERLLALRTELENYRRALPQETFARVLDQRMTSQPDKRWTWRWLIAPVAAMSVAIVAILLLQREPENPELTQWRGDAVTFLRQRGDDVVVLHQGDKVRVGDRLSVVARSNNQASLRLRIADQGSSGTTYYPSNGTVLVQGETTFPGSIVVTPPCHAMTFTLVDSKNDVALADPLQLGCD